MLTSHMAPLHCAAAVDAAVKQRQCCFYMDEVAVMSRKWCTEMRLIPQVCPPAHAPYSSILLLTCNSRTLNAMC